MIIVSFSKKKKLVLAVESFWMAAENSNRYSYLNYAAVVVVVVAIVVVAVVVVVEMMAG